MKIPKQFFFCLLLFFMTGCSITSTATEAEETQPPVKPSPTIPLATYEPTLTLTRSVTTTLVATRTPSPSISPTAKLTLTQFPNTRALDPQGPYGLLISEDGLWAFNPDGTGFTQLTSDQIMWAIPAPDGKTVALVTYVPDIEYGLELKLLTLPDGNIHSITRLDLPLPETPTLEQDLNALQVHTAIFLDNSLAWSPDGSLLAFVSGHNGVSTDVYTYSPQTEQIAHLTEGPSMAYNLSWSPDGKYILHAGAYSFGTGRGYNMAGVWVVGLDGQVTTPYLLKDSNPEDPYTGSNDEIWIGWLNKDTVLVYSWNSFWANTNLRAVNIASQTEYRLMTGTFEDISYNPYSRLILVSVLYDMSDMSPDFQKRGTYIVRPGNELVQISEDNYLPLPFYTKDGWYAQKTMTNDPNVIVFIKNDGTIQVIEDRMPLIEDRYLSEKHLFLSPDHFIWASTTELTDEVWISSPSISPRQLHAGVSKTLGWSPDGAILFFYSIDETGSAILYKAQAPDFEPVMIWRFLEPVNNRTWLLQFTSK
jgi:WD40 repeat protein